MLNPTLFVLLPLLYISNALSIPASLFENSEIYELPHNQSLLARDNIPPITEWSLLICNDASIDKYMDWRTLHWNPAYPGKCSAIIKPGTVCDTFKVDRGGHNWVGDVRFVRPIGEPCWFYQTGACDGGKRGKGHDARKYVLKVEADTSKSLVGIGDDWDRGVNHYRCRKHRKSKM